MEESSAISKNVPLSALISSNDESRPPPSPLSGAYLLIVISEPQTEAHKSIILQKLAKAFLSWDINISDIDIERELAIVTALSPEGDFSKSGERLIQNASEHLVTEILIHPQINTMRQCIRNLLSSFTKYRFIIHSGYAFHGNGSWILQDGTFSIHDFIDAFQEIEVQRVIRAYEKSVKIDICCISEGNWNQTRINQEAFTNICQIEINPRDKISSGNVAVNEFIEYLTKFVIASNIEELLEESDLVGNIRFTHPTLYIFPGGEGDAALFGINGFNMLVDGGFNRKACFWNFVRHLDRLDAVLLTRINNVNIGGMAGIIQRKVSSPIYPQIGHFFSNIQANKNLPSPDGDKDKEPLLVNLIEEGHRMVTNLKQLQLKPHPCYRNSNTDPINLYHKVGHGKLDMYVISPAKDSQEVKEFLSRWNNHDIQLFSGTSLKSENRELRIPLQNMVSICAMLVWQPANVDDHITRILFPGSAPEQKILEGLEKFKHLEILKHSTCTTKSISALQTGSIRTSVKTKISTIDKIIPDEYSKSDIKDVLNVENETDVILPESKIISRTKAAILKTKHKPIEKDIVTKDNTDIKLIKRDENLAEINITTTNITDTTATATTTSTVTSSSTTNVTSSITTSNVNKLEEKKKSEYKRIVKVEGRKFKPPTSLSTADRKSESEKSSPTTPKKINSSTKLMKTDVTKESAISKTTTRTTNRMSTPPKVHVTAAKSVKDENNRKMAEAKQQQFKKTPPKSTTISSKLILKKEENTKVEKKLTVAKKEKSTSAKYLSSIMSDNKKPVSIKPRSAIKYESEKTDSSAVSTPSTADADVMLIKLKETQIIPHVEDETNIIDKHLAEQKSPTAPFEINVNNVLANSDSLTAVTIATTNVSEKDNVSTRAYISNMIIKDGEKERKEDLDEDDEILIIETTEMKPVNFNEQKYLKDEKESEKHKKFIKEKHDNEIFIKNKIENVELKLTEEVSPLKCSHSLTPEEKQTLFGEVDGIISIAKKIVNTSGKNAEEESNLAFDNSKEYKISEEKELIKITDEKLLSTIESSSTTTAPTMPEDEKVEDYMKYEIKEKYDIEETKEKHTEILSDIVQQYSKDDETVFDKACQQDMTKTSPLPLLYPSKKDAIKTPDEVADLPVYEEADLQISNISNKNEVVFPREEQMTFSEPVVDVVVPQQVEYVTISPTPSSPNEKPLSEISENALHDDIYSKKLPSLTAEEKSLPFPKSTYNEKLFTEINKNELTITKPVNIDLSEIKIKSKNKIEVESNKDLNDKLILHPKEEELTEQIVKDKLVSISPHELSCFKNLHDYKADKSLPDLDIKNEHLISKITSQLSHDMESFVKIIEPQESKEKSIEQTKNILEDEERSSLINIDTEDKLILQFENKIIDHHEKEQSQMPLNITEENEKQDVGAEKEKDKENKFEKVDNETEGQKKEHEMDPKTDTIEEKLIPSTDLSEKIDLSKDIYSINKISMEKGEKFTDHLESQQKQDSIIVDVMAVKEAIKLPSKDAMKMRENEKEEIIIPASVSITDIIDKEKPIDSNLEKDKEILTVHKTKEVVNIIESEKIMLKDFLDEKLKSDTKSPRDMNEIEVNKYEKIIVDHTNSKLPEEINNKEISNEVKYTQETIDNNKKINLDDSCFEINLKEKGLQEVETNLKQVTADKFLSKNLLDENIIEKLSLKVSPSFSESADFQVDNFLQKNLPNNTVLHEQKMDKDKTIVYEKLDNEIKQKESVSATSPEEALASSIMQHDEVKETITTPIPFITDSMISSNFNISADSNLYTVSGISDYKESQKIEILPKQEKTITEEKIETTTLTENNIIEKNTKSLEENEIKEEITFVKFIDESKLKTYELSISEEESQKINESNVEHAVIPSVNMANETNEIQRLSMDKKIDLKFENEKTKHEIAENALSDTGVSSASLMSNNLNENIQKSKKDFENQLNTDTTENMENLKQVPLDQDIKQESFQKQKNEDNTEFNVTEVFKEKLHVITVDEKKNDDDDDDDDEFKQSIQDDISFTSESSQPSLIEKIKKIDEISDMNDSQEKEIHKDQISDIKQLQEKEIKEEVKFSEIQESQEKEIHKEVQMSDTKELQEKETKKEDKVSNIKESLEKETHKEDQMSDMKESQENKIQKEDQKFDIKTLEEKEIKEEVKFSEIQEPQEKEIYKEDEMSDIKESQEKEIHKEDQMSDTKESQEKKIQKEGQKSDINTLEEKEIKEEVKFSEIQESQEKEIHKEVQMSDTKELQENETKKEDKVSNIKESLEKETYKEDQMSDMKESQENKIQKEDQKFDIKTVEEKEIKEEVKFSEIQEPQEKEIHKDVQMSDTKELQEKEMKKEDKVSNIKESLEKETHKEDQMSDMKESQEKKIQKEGQKSDINTLEEKEIKEEVKFSEIQESQEKEIHKEVQMSDTKELQEKETKKEDKVSNIKESLEKETYKEDQMSDMKESQENKIQKEDQKFDIKTVEEKEIKEEVKFSEIQEPQEKEIHKDVQMSDTKELQEKEMKKEDKVSNIKESLEKETHKEDQMSDMKESQENKIQKEDQKFDIKKLEEKEIKEEDKFSEIQVSQEKEIYKEDEMSDIKESQEKEIHKEDQMSDTKESQEKKIQKEDQKFDIKTVEEKEIKEEVKFSEIQEPQEKEIHKDVQMSDTKELQEKEMKKEDKVSNIKESLEKETHKEDQMSDINTLEEKEIKEEVKFSEIQESQEKEIHKEVQMSDTKELQEKETKKEDKVSNIKESLEKETYKEDQMSDMKESQENKIQKEDQKFDIKTVEEKEIKEEVKFSEIQEPQEKEIHKDVQMSDTKELQEKEMKKEDKVSNIKESLEKETHKEDQMSDMKESQENKIQKEDQKFDIKKLEEKEIKEEDKFSEIQVSQEKEIYKEDEMSDIKESQEKEIHKEDQMSDTKESQEKKIQKEGQKSDINTLEEKEIKEVVKFSEIQELQEKEIHKDVQMSDTKELQEKETKKEDKVSNIKESLEKETYKEDQMSDMKESQENKIQKEDQKFDIKTLEEKEIKEEVKFSEMQESQEKEIHKEDQMSDTKELQVEEIKDEVKFSDIKELQEKEIYKEDQMSDMEILHEKEMKKEDKFSDIKISQEKGIHKEDQMSDLNELQEKKTKKEDKFPDIKESLEKEIPKESQMSNIKESEEKGAQEDNVSAKESQEKEMKKDDKFSGIRESKKTENQKEDSDQKVLQEKEIEKENQITGESQGNETQNDQISTTSKLQKSVEITDSITANNISKTHKKLQEKDATSEYDDTKVFSSDEEIPLKTNDILISKLEDNDYKFDKENNETLSSRSDHFENIQNVEHIELEPEITNGIFVRQSLGFEPKKQEKSSVELSNEDICKESLIKDKIHVPLSMINNEAEKMEVSIDHAIKEDIHHEFRDKKESVVEMAEKISDTEHIYNQILSQTTDVAIKEEMNKEEGKISLKEEKILSKTSDSSTTIMHLEENEIGKCATDKMEKPIDITSTESDMKMNIEQTLLNTTDMFNQEAFVKSAIPLTEESIEMLKDTNIKIKHSEQDILNKCDDKLITKKLEILPKDLQQETEKVKDKVDTEYSSVENIESLKHDPIIRSNLTSIKDVYKTIEHADIKIKTECSTDNNVKSFEEETISKLLMTSFKDETCSLDDISKDARTEIPEQKIYKLECQEELQEKKEIKQDVSKKITSELSLAAEITDESKETFSNKIEIFSEKTVENLPELREFKDKTHESFLLMESLSQEELKSQTITQETIAPFYLDNKTIQECEAEENILKKSSLWSANETDQHLAQSSQNLQESIEFVEETNILVDETKHQEKNEQDEKSIPNEKTEVNDKTIEKSFNLSTTTTTILPELSSSPSASTAVVRTCVFPSNTSMSSKNESSSSFKVSSPELYLDATQMSVRFTSDKKEDEETKKITSKSKSNNEEIHDKISNVQDSISNLTSKSEKRESVIKTVSLPILDERFEESKISADVADIADDFSKSYPSLEKISHLETKSSPNNLSDSSLFKQTEMELQSKSISLPAIKRSDDSDKYMTLPHLYKTNNLEDLTATKTLITTTTVTTPVTSKDVEKSDRKYSIEEKVPEEFVASIIPIKEVDNESLPEEEYILSKTIQNTDHESSKKSSINENLSPTTATLGTIVKCEIFQKENLDLKYEKDINTEQVLKVIQHKDDNQDLQIHESDKNKLEKVEQKYISDNKDDNQIYGHTQSTNFEDMAISMTQSFYAFSNEEDFDRCEDKQREIEIQPSNEKEKENLKTQTITTQIVFEQKNEKDEELFSSTDVQKDPIHDWGKPLGLPAARNIDSSYSWNPLENWGKPLGLPSPGPTLPFSSTQHRESNGDIEISLTPINPKGTPKKISKKIVEKNKTGREPSKTRDTSSKKSKSMKQVAPIYVDLAYVPHHGNSNYTTVEFFKQIRARYYVFSGTDPSKDVFKALLEAKKSWENHDLEVTIISTYDTDALGFWITENEEILENMKIDLAPSASRCTINLQDHDTSCSAYRLEF